MPDRARAPLALRALAHRLARPEAPTFDLELMDGSVHRMGLGARPAFRLALRSSRGKRALLSMDETRIGEAYMRSHLDFEGDVLAALVLRRVFSDRHPLASIWRFVQPWLLGDARADKTWVPQHYDYGNDLYFAFLDRKFRLYSQALYHSENDTLEQAAQNKLDWILDACRLHGGRRVLDVGGGWGSFAGHAASRGVHETMLIISREQNARAHRPPQ